MFYAPADATSYVRLNGRNVVSLGIVRQAQSNSVAISDGVRAVVDRLNRGTGDLQLTIVSDDAVFIRGAIAEVLWSLGLAVLIVVAVVGAFLGQWRATLVPVVAIPVALIGTLAAIWLLGFSLNLLTLLALLLATGLVVDDAIVVLENIQRRRAAGPRPARGRRARHARGVLRRRRHHGHAGGGVRADLVPALGGRPAVRRVRLRDGHSRGAVVFRGAVAGADDRIAAARTAAARAVVAPAVGVGCAAVRAYERTLAVGLRHGWCVLAASAGLAVAAAWLYTTLDQELTPVEDRGVLTIRLDGPDGAGLAYSDRQLDLALAAVTPLRDAGLVQNLYTVTGRYDFNRAEIVAPLIDWSEREMTQAQLAAKLQKQLDTLPGMRVRIRAGSSLGTGGGDGSVRMAVTGDDYPRIAEAADAFAEAIERELPALRDVRVEYNTSQPQLTLRIDRQRAADLGVSVEGLDILLRALVDGTEVIELAVNDRSVPVMLESSLRGATDPQDLLMMQVRTNEPANGATAGTGRLVSLSQFVRFEETAIASELERFGQRRAVEISAVAAEGVPLQQAVDSLRELATRQLPPGMGLLFRGDAATLEQTGRDVAVTFAIALLVVFLVLVAQFEGLTSAAVVLIIVPFGLAAAVFALWLSGTTLNIYSQIGLLLLVGVMAKNSILMVEFADQLRDAGRSVAEAAHEAACTRLRPILMTMASTVLGAVPLVLGSGAGAESRAAIGWVIFGGLSLAALFTLFLTPVVYLGLARFAKPRARQGERLASEMKAAGRVGQTSRAGGAACSYAPAQAAARRR